MNESSPLKLAVVGAGPVGLALALHAAQALPDAAITLFDARAEDKDVSADPRTLALSLGSIRLLERLGAWRADRAEPILEVHVSQQPPSLLLPFAGRLGEAELVIRAIDEAVPMLGAVLAYGAIVAPLQQVWREASGREPNRLASRFGTPVAALKNLEAGVEVDSGIAERFDLAVVAEGGVFAAAPGMRSSRRRRRHGATTIGRRRGSGRRPSCRPPTAPRAGAASPSSASRATARPRCCRCPMAAPAWCGAWRATTTRCASSTPASGSRC